MKNIHLLSTDKPSRLVGSILNLSLKDIPISSFDAFKTYNMYITSNEVIKKGNWYIADNKLYRANVDHMPELYTYPCKKIILTTDQDLIKDGVQEIDDKFLEWFVKNPSCEEVEAIPLRKSSGYYDEKEVWHWDFLAYKIIIPKEEPKQETLEEAAERFLKNGAKEFKTAKQVLIEFAKWQQEQNKNLYSEEEVYTLLNNALWDLSEMGYNQKKLDEWFEQFKKK